MIRIAVRPSRSLGDHPFLGQLPERRPLGLILMLFLPLDVRRVFSGRENRFHLLAPDPCTVDAHRRTVTAGDALLLVRKATGKTPFASAARQDADVEAAAIGFLDRARGGKNGLESYRSARIRLLNAVRET